MARGEVELSEHVGRRDQLPEEVVVRLGGNQGAIGRAAVAHVVDQPCCTQAPRRVCERGHMNHAVVHILAVVVIGDVAGRTTVAEGDVRIGGDERLAGKVCDRTVEWLPGEDTQAHDGRAECDGKLGGKVSAAAQPRDGDCSRVDVESR
eukprot:227515-Prymnesium_polylepis.1